MTIVVLPKIYPGPNLLLQQAMRLMDIKAMLQNLRGKYTSVQHRPWTHQKSDDDVPNLACCPIQIPLSISWSPASRKPGDVFGRDKSCLRRVGQPSTSNVRTRNVTVGTLSIHSTWSSVLNHCSCFQSSGGQGLRCEIIELGIGT